MIDFATYDGATGQRTGLGRGKGWKHVGVWPEFLKDSKTPHPRAGQPKFETTGDLKAMAARGDDVRGWALSKAEALAGRTIYPLNLIDAPAYDEHEESLAQVLDHNPATDEIDQTWTKPPHSGDTRLQRRQAKLDEGRALLMAAIGREGPAWDNWRALRDEQNTALRRDTIAPRDLDWPPPQNPLNII